MARTRSKPTPKEATPLLATSTAKPIPPSVENAPKLFVLPKDTSKEARIVALDNPATEQSSRYLFCPEKGFYEFTRIGAPKKACKSWLITSEKRDEEGEEADEEPLLGTGYVSKTPDLFVATPIDLLFLILPALAPKSAKDTKQLFLCLDDHLDKLSSSSSQHWTNLLAQYPTLRSMIEGKMGAFCDTVDAGDEKMYRLSHEKLFQIIVKKAQRICDRGFPSSMEEKFIKPALHIPVMSIKREESSLTNASEEPASQTLNSQASSAPSTVLDSQTSTETTETAATNLSTPSTDTPLTTPPSIPPLLRLRTTLTYILTTYIPPLLHPPLQSLLATSTSPSFEPLNTHLATLSTLKAEAAALRSISDNISRKRALDEEDEEKAAGREEKKRKKEEEERKKKSESRGVRQLKKADTSGMMKLSSFFTKKG
ncbi:hypothetical protein EJ04DRAFT_547154 [Polyplosphaeria fusca]|uniref:Ribonuclease H2 subunit B n=1 Tax=Polyplosphaeria fusca TaxID=682080 RepID=A0A9P4QMP7_9PLEO|nr:hypothetical protein EJ04DRAFT_547154 [Polyplosphaeria fusca]